MVVKAIYSCNIIIYLKTYNSGGKKLEKIFVGVSSTFSGGNGVWLHFRSDN